MHLYPSNIGNDMGRFIWFLQRLGFGWLRRNVRRVKSRLQETTAEASSVGVFAWQSAGCEPRLLQGSWGTPLKICTAPSPHKCWETETVEIPIWIQQSAVLTEQLEYMITIRKDFGISSREMRGPKNTRFYDSKVATQKYMNLNTTMSRTYEHCVTIHSHDFSLISNRREYILYLHPSPRWNPGNTSLFNTKSKVKSWKYLIWFWNAWFSL